MSASWSPSAFIAGRFVETRRADQEIVSVDPGRTDEIVARFRVREASVDEAIEAARRALPEWRRIPERSRARMLRRFARHVEADRDALARLITRESGKPLWEARQEVALLARKVDVTLGRGLERVRGFRVEDGGRCEFRPRGVLAVLGPFNFPLHLPNGHIVPSLVTGNTVVFKPSEVTPAVAVRYARLLHRAGCPPGVFNLVVGDGRLGRRLALDERVDGVLFTGSAAVGRALKADTLDAPGKLLALEMGGKNAAVVLADADLGLAVRECALGAFLTTGQRCTATSRIVVERKVADRFVDSFVSCARRLSIGYGLDADVFMGPLATKAAVSKFERAQRWAESEGDETLLRGGRARRRDVAHRGHYVTPSIHLVRKSSADSPYQDEEIFAPDVAIYVADGLEEAVQIADQTRYGLALSVFTRSRRKLAPFFEGCRVGVFNWNRSTVGASSALPFGGQRQSGNDRPTASFATDYCTYPVAMLEGGPGGSFLPPGFPKERAS